MYADMCIHESFWDAIVGKLDEPGLRIIDLRINWGSGRVLLLIGKLEGVNATQEAIELEQNLLQETISTPEMNKSIVQLLLLCHVKKLKQLYQGL